MLLWLFTLIVPAITIFFGAYFRKKSPREINMLFGYRTDMSMKNRDTWEFAHRCIGKYWLITGLILLPIAVITALICPQSEAALTTILTIEPIFLFPGIILTEIRLHKAFDKDGNRR